MWNRPAEVGSKPHPGRRQRLVETHLVEPEAEESIGDDVLYLRLPASDTTPQESGSPIGFFSQDGAVPGQGGQGGYGLVTVFRCRGCRSPFGPDFVGSDPNGWVRKTGLSR